MVIQNIWLGMFLKSWNLGRSSITILLNEGDDTSSERVLDHTKKTILIESRVQFTRHKSWLHIQNLQLILFQNNNTAYDKTNIIAATNLSLSRRDV